MKRLSLILSMLFAAWSVAVAQQPVSVGAGSYASFAPLSESRTASRGGSLAYHTEHRRLYLPDSLLQRLSSPDGQHEGTLALPTNDSWTYAMVNQWTGKVWLYPGWVEAAENGIDIGYPDHWEETGSEVKWQETLHVDFLNTLTGRRADFKEALVDNYSDFMCSLLMYDHEQWVRVTCMQGSPLVWIEAEGMTMSVKNPDEQRYGVAQMTKGSRQMLTVALLTEGLTSDLWQTYAWRVPRLTRVEYDNDVSRSLLNTTFVVFTEDLSSGSPALRTDDCLMAFLPHHYYSHEGSANPYITPATTKFLSSAGHDYLTYLSPRGTMRLAEGNRFSFTYAVNHLLPFFPAPAEWAEGYSPALMHSLAADYAQKGSFGADTYWGGKGLTQMMHYMTFALQTGDTAVYLQAKERLRDALVDWLSYTPGEQDRYFARFPRFGALVGFDPSYDSETFNDHHFHYGYFTYAAAVLCMLDNDFREQYGPMARELAMDYACHERDNRHYPWLRTFNPYCGHSFAGGMGNQGNGNGQESSSESMQAWGGMLMLALALGDKQMYDAAVFGYTVEARAIAEYWFDRQRRNIDYTKYQHPYCCNLTMQGVGWWTWFSGDPVWMHSIQWMPISTLLTNYMSEDLRFARWDYTEMYSHKHVGNYEAPSAGLGDESGLGNVCLSYLSLFDADSAARVWDRAYQQGKALARNTDTGGITYFMTHAHRSLGERRFDIFSDNPLACAYTDTLTGTTTYAVYNINMRSMKVRFFGAKDTTITVQDLGMSLITDKSRVNHPVIYVRPVETEADALAWTLPYPNLALRKTVTASSFENAGTRPESLTDGDRSTRWGSAHQDGEYAVVDLTQTCYIDHLILRWEAAYATEYEVGLSDDQQTWTTITLSSSGGTEQVALARLLAAEKKTSRGRYLRITGNRRATQYGTSLYELEAYGRPVQGKAGVLFALDLKTDQEVLSETESTNITITGYDALGGKVSCEPELSITAGEAVIEGKRLIATVPGIVELTAKKGDVQTSCTVVVMEVEHADSLVITPAEVTLPVGQTQRFSLFTVNQFGFVADTCYESFTATATGDTLLTFHCQQLTATVLVHRVLFTEMNLAYGKPATASGSENDGTGAANAVDGQTDTRWSSRFQDEEWIEIDLEECYRLTSVRLLWENAYATDYDILLSEDGVDYQTAYTATEAKGGTEDIELNGGQPTEAQYVRLLCHKRNTGYGASLWELEVYGTGRCEKQPSVEDSVEEITLYPAQARKVLREGQLFIITPSGDCYDAIGRPTPCR